MRLDRGTVLNRGGYVIEHPKTGEQTFADVKIETMHIKRKEKEPVVATYYEVNFGDGDKYYQVWKRLEKLRVKGEWKQAKVTARISFLKAWKEAQEKERQRVEQELKMRPTLF